jgi:hypothetical protein
VIVAAALLQMPAWLYFFTGGNVMPHFRHRDSEIGTTPH